MRSNRVVCCLLAAAFALWLSPAMGAAPEVEPGRTPAPPRILELPDPIGTVVFNGSIQQSGEITATLTREAVGFSLNGSISPPASPRWALPRWAVQPTKPEVLAETGTHRVFAGGFDSDGQSPVLVSYSSTGASLTVHRGAGDIAAYWAGEPNNTYVKQVNSAPFSTPPDLLQGQSNAIDGVRFAPAGAAVWDGVIAVSCSVRELHDVGGVPVWQARRSSLLWTTTELLVNDPEPWRIAGISKDSGYAPGKTTLQHWSISRFPIDDQRCVVMLADYRAPAEAKTGGMVDAYLITRTPGGSASVDGVSLFDRSTPGQHVHVGGFVRHPDGSATALASFGDTQSANVLLARTVASLDRIIGTDPEPGTGIAGVGVLRAASGWGPVVTAWGSDGPTPTIHNQVISMVPADEDLSAVLCGGDENGASILRLTYDPIARKARFEQVLLPAVTSNPSDGVLVFGLQALRAGGPFVAVQNGPVSWGRPDGIECRLLWSPDGVVWGQLPWTGADEQAPAVFEGEGVIVSGSIVPGRFRRLKIGEQNQIVTPLALAGMSSANLLAAGDQVRPVTPPADLVATRLTTSDLGQLGIQPPPCHTGQLFRFDQSGTDGRMGTWMLTGPAPGLNRPGTGGLMIKLWVYAIPPEAGGPTNSCRVSLRPLAVNAGGQTVGSRWISGTAFDAGRWTPITVWLDSRTIDGQVFYTQDPGQHRIDLELSVHRASTAGNPGSFLVCFDSVSLGALTIDGYGASPGPANDEELTVSFGHREAWTVFYDAYIPEQLWDARTGSVGSAYRPKAALATIPGGDHEVEVSLEIPLSTISLRAGSSTRYAGFYETFAVRQSRVRVAVASDGQRTTTCVWIAGRPAQLLTVQTGTDADHIKFGRLPLDLARVVVFDRALTARQMKLLFDAPPSVAAPCTADYDGNGRLDFFDIGLFISDFSASNKRADFNGDGRVDFFDVAAFLAAYRAGCP